MLHGDGDPLLIEYKDEEFHSCYVAMRSDIGKSAIFKDKVGLGELYDLETPYGYGGPLIEGVASDKAQQSFLKEFSTYCHENRIVSQFVRFHPLLGNHDLMPCFFETRYLRDTIYIDTETSDLIMRNMDSKNRNMVRKAIKNGITVEQRPIQDYRDFMEMYEETMIRDNADKYYIFHEDYFKFQDNLKDNACIFYAMFEGKPVAGSIIYFNDRFVHYHLSGSYAEYRKYAPTNLLLYEVARWASGRGIKKFHLGGGMTPDDNLFGFKKQFNKNGRLPFMVGRTIFDTVAYENLLKIREESDPSFDANNSRMIQYRA